MTKDKILKMDDRGLYIAVMKFIDPNNWELPYKSYPCTSSGPPLFAFLAVCYQAEEKLLGMPNHLKMMSRYEDNLDSLLKEEQRTWDEHGFLLIHAHPRQRAQAVLLTIEDIHKESEVG